MSVHESIIKLFVTLDYTNDKNGCCHGISLRWIEACLTEEEPLFDQRIRTIATKQHNPVQNIYNAQVKKGKKLTQQDKQALSLLPFLESMTLYQFPMEHSVWFGSTHDLSQHDIEEISYIASSDTILKLGGLADVYSEPLIYTINELQNYLDCLGLTIENTYSIPNKIVGIILTNHEHTIALTYTTSKGWKFMDINQYPSKSFGIIDTARLTQKIVSGFKTLQSPYIAFNSRVITTGHNLQKIQLKNALNEFKKKHLITKEIAQRTETVNLAYIATRNRHYLVLQELAQNGADLKMTYKNYNLAHIAAIHGYDEFIELLNTQGVDLNATNSESWTPAILAAQHGHSNVIDALVKYEVNLHYKDKNGCNVGHFAAQNGHIQILTTLGKNKVNFNEVDDWGASLAHYAVDNNHPEIIEELARQKTDLNISNKIGLTPIFSAAQNGCLRSIFALIKYGISPHCINPAGQTLIHHAVQFDHPAVIAALVTHFQLDLDVKDFSGWTAAHYAAYENKINSLITLAQCNAKLNSLALYSRTPAFYAVAKGHPEILAVLCQYGISLSYTDKYHRTLVHHAVRFNQPLIISELAKQGVSLDTPDFYGWTPIFYAAQEHSPELLVQLLSHGVDHDKKDMYGWTLAHFAAQNGCGKILAELAKHEIKLNLPDSKGFTPISYAIQIGNIPAIVELIKANISFGEPLSIRLDHFKEFFIGEEEVIIERMNEFLGVENNKKFVSITPLQLTHIIGHPSLINLINKTKEIHALYQKIKNFNDYGIQLSDFVQSISYQKEGKKVLLVARQLEKQANNFIQASFETGNIQAMRGAQKEFKKIIHQAYLEIQTHKTAWKPFLFQTAIAANGINLFQHTGPHFTTGSIFFMSQPKKITTEPTSGIKPPH